MSIEFNDDLEGVWFMDVNDTYAHGLEVDLADALLRERLSTEL